MAMNDLVQVEFTSRRIAVNYDTLTLDEVTPKFIENYLPDSIVSPVVSMRWIPNQPSQTSMSQERGSDVRIEMTEENYIKFFKPYVDVWQAEKDRLEQEKIEAEQEYAKFENRKERALDKIVNDYHGALENGFVRTSMGFDADISPDSVATLSATNIALSRNILGEKAPKTVFRDFYGLQRELDAVQVELLICQINAAQNHIRELKYAFKTKVKETHDNDSLNAALDTCIYSTLDFSNLVEDSKPSALPFEQTSTYVERIDTF